MDCCRATERHFNETVARRDVERYRRRGPDSVTRRLLAALADLDLTGATLLDVGGGMGAIPFELFPRGVQQAALVEIAWAYVGQARAEAERRGVADRLRAVHGDVVRVAHRLAHADLVTLDRVVCCYPDCELLLAAALSRCRRWCALSYPRERWYVKAVVALENGIRRLTGNPFRIYVHPVARIEGALAEAGFQRRFRGGTLVWEVAVYEK